MSHGIDCHFAKHSYHVIVGDNGSGKTTLFKIMVGLLTPDEGSIQIDDLSFGKNDQDILKRIGVILADDRTLYHKLTAYENLYYIGRIYHIPKRELKERIPQLLGQLNLANDKKLVENFSTGMKKKLMIARALLTNPDYILGDEVFNGLDEDAKQRVGTLFDKLCDEGKTIIIITHILDCFPEHVILHRMEKGTLR